MGRTPASAARKRVAIVGSGVSGIAAAWALQNSDYEVHIYEEADRLGGHTNTVDFHHGKYKTAVDTGFIVLNTATYPNFINFLKTVNVPTIPTQMTFSVSRDSGLFEWAGTNLLTLFAQPSNLRSLSMWRMIFDIIRFNQYALDLLTDSADSDDLDRDPTDFPEEETIGSYLKREGYSNAFRDDYLIPMTAAVWSTSPDKCSLEFPAVTLVRFLWNHHLLTTVGARPQWLTLKQGSKSYIDAVFADFTSSQIHLQTPISKLKFVDDDKIELYTSESRTKLGTFDKVVLATHGPTTSKIIRASASYPEPFEAEKEILSAFKTSPNIAFLHSDTSLLPQRRKAWAAWNYLTLSKGYPSAQKIDQVCLTYNMNILQHIPTRTFGDVLVTLNPLHRPKEIQGEYRYEHPLYTVQAMEAQRRLPSIQGRRGVYYAGAWTKYGFHEDGFSSGLEAALDIGAEIPFEFTDSRYSRGKRPVLGLRDYALRVVLWLLIRVMKLLTLVLGKRSKAVTNGISNPSWARVNASSSSSDAEGIKKD